MPTPVRVHFLDRPLFSGTKRRVDQREGKGASPHRRGGGSADEVARPTARGPGPIEVALDGDEARVPNAIEIDGSSRWVEAVGESWRIDDEWWRNPVERRYVEVVLEGGKHVTVYEDLMTGEWYLQGG